MKTRVAILLWVLGSVVATAQVSSPPELRFEVASVKQNVSGRIQSAIQVPSAGQISFTNVPLRILIRNAYNIDAFAEAHKLDPGRFADFVGTSASGPNPNSPRFDVRAKPPDNTQPVDRRAMLRVLLEERFKLRVHREMREMPVYALVVAREGRVGPNLMPSKFDCLTYAAQNRAGQKVEEPVDSKGRPLCGPPATPDSLATPGVLTSRFAGPMRVLAQRLEPQVQRPVVDATGLEGNFEWTVTFAIGPNSVSDFPSVFTAIQEQLGLRLESRREPVEVLVIDHIELPTPD